MPTRTQIAFVVAAVLLAACSKSEPTPQATKTKAQRDSAIANSGLPGAEGVAKAMRVADSAKARQAALDSVLKP